LYLFKIFTLKNVIIYSFKILDFQKYLFTKEVWLFNEYLYLLKYLFKQNINWKRKLGWSFERVNLLIFLSIGILLYFNANYECDNKNQQAHFDSYLLRNLAKRHYSACLLVRAERLIGRTIFLWLFTRSNFHPHLPLRTTSTLSDSRSTSPPI